MKRQKIDLGLTGYDELFMNDSERKENRLPKINQLVLVNLDILDEYLETFHIVDEEFYK